MMPDNRNQYKLTKKYLSYMHFMRHDMTISNENNLVIKEKKFTGKKISKSQMNSFAVH